jgi:hypothetical protein
VKKFKLQVAKKDKEITQLNEKLHNQSKIQHQMVGGGGRWIYILLIKYAMASFFTQCFPRHELELGNICMLCSLLPPLLSPLEQTKQKHKLALTTTFAFPFLNTQAAEVKELHKTKSKLDRRDKEISMLNAKIEEQVKKIHI